jgi:hypothetical protein
MEDAMEDNQQPNNRNSGIPDANDLNKLSASRTDDLDLDIPDPNSPLEFDEYGNEVKDQTNSDLYHDDLDSDNDDVDPFMDEATDDPTEELGVPPEEYKDELDKIALDDLEHDHEDSREALEDADEADDSSAANA